MKAVNSHRSSVNRLLPSVVSCPLSMAKPQSSVLQFFGGRWSAVVGPFWETLVSDEHRAKSREQGARSMKLKPGIQNPMPSRKHTYPLFFRVFPFSCFRDHVLMVCRRSAVCRRRSFISGRLSAFEDRRQHGTSGQLSVISYQ